jgi:hypothetical protein
MSVSNEWDPFILSWRAADKRRGSEIAVAWWMRNRDEQSARRVERVSGILVGICGVLIVGVTFGVYFVAGFEYFRPSTLITAGLFAVTLLGAAVGAYTHSEADDKIGFVLLWLPLPLVFMGMFSAVGIFLLPVLALVFAMTGSASVVEERSRRRK